MSFLLLVALSIHAAIVGTSKPAESLTAARVATRPVAEQKPWLDYLKRSDAQRAVDQAALAAERAGLTGAVPALPKESSSASSIPVKREAAFYKTPEAMKIAETILSFQIPNGGWSKNLNMTAGPRLRGQSYATNNVSRYLGENDFDAPRDPAWNYMGTLDNDATNTELRYLVRMAAAYPGAEGERFRASFIKGVRYLLAAQFPNGGWPQVWPLEGGYHDAITYNDNAVTESASVLQDVSASKGFLWVPAALRTDAAAAAARAVECILRTQIRAGAAGTVAGRRTVWAQQFDALTLLPVAGRNFEPAALSAGESADVLLFLMQLRSPAPGVIAAVEGGVRWLRENAIRGQKWTGGRETAAGPGNPDGGRYLEAAAGAGPIWARYTSLETGKAVFGDRDKSIHDNVMELSVERRNGYAWYSAGPKAALDAYPAWRTDTRPQS